MSNIDLKALREFALFQRDDEIGLGVVCHPAETLIDMLDRLEAAERERDEMRRRAVTEASYSRQLVEAGTAIARAKVRCLGDDSRLLDVSEQIGILAAERDELHKDAERMRDAIPELDRVIKWLAKGCNVPRAVEELSIYKARIDAAMAQEGGK